MTERLITHLRHVDLAVPNYAEQRSFYLDTWGLTEEATDGNLSYMAAEGSTEPFVVRLREADEKRIDLISLGAADRNAVDQLAQQLGSADVQLVTEPGELATYGGGYGFRFFDGDGRTLEVCTDVEQRTAREIEPMEAIPKALSHVVLNSNKPEETVAWYLKHLGVAVSDQLTMPGMGDLMWFLRCNSWHHTFAVVRGPHTSLHHLSFEMRGVEENMMATGRVLRAGIERIWGPGKHLAGDNMFNYFIDPAGNTMEYTTELELIDEETWEAHEYSIVEPLVADQWGTANNMGPDVAEKSFNAPDRGVFVAPPV
jgi:catechol 2,3-dioxygenase-like lactoylglutathione lyase family enzyme